MRTRSWLALSAAPLVAGLGIAALPATANAWGGAVMVDELYVETHAPGPSPAMLRKNRRHRIEKRDHDTRARPKRAPLYRKSRA